MEKLKGKKIVTMILFLMCIFLYSAINIKKELPVLQETFEKLDFSQELKKQIQSVESAVNDNVAGKYYFIDAYGYLQRLLGKNEESNFEVVKDTEGKLHYTYFTDKPNDTHEVAKRAANLKKALEGETKVIYVLPPEKYIKGHTKFDRGLPYPMANEAADLFVEYLKDYDIPCLDLRDSLRTSGLDMTEVFYTTDHHWKIETAFWAASCFDQWMNETFGENIDPEGFYKEKSNYNWITYKEISLGSMGRKTGRYYAGVDDFTLIYPKFETMYTYVNSLQPDLKYIGRFEEALMATPMIRQSSDPFDADMYMSYLYGNPAFSHIENMN
ncbi:MAG: hypothetical protein K2P60_05770, partial [Lachnospiraceae bacterium]|nr:hypothetical protein [Lachnospiraceae bacterium]